MMKKRIAKLIGLFMLLFLPTVSFAMDLPDDVNASLYEAELNYIASDARIAGPSQPWYMPFNYQAEGTHHEEVKNFCASLFNNLGYEVEEEEFCGWSISGYYCGINVIGTKPGTTRPDEIIYISAHYDSVDVPDPEGGMCKSADDNASAVAGVWESARILSLTNHARTLKVACWDREEEGTVGSLYHANQARRNDDNIIVSYVYEMIGYTDESPGSQGLAGSEAFADMYPDQYHQIVNVNEDKADFLLAVYNSRVLNMGLQWIESPVQSAVLMEDAAAASGLKLYTLAFNPWDTFVYPGYGKSDHLAFWTHSFPAMMITDTSVRNPNYHCQNGPDSVHTLNIDFAVKTVDAVTYSALQTLNPEE